MLVRAAVAASFISASMRFRSSRTLGSQPVYSTNRCRPRVFNSLHLQTTVLPLATARGQISHARGKATSDSIHFPSRRQAYARSSTYKSTTFVSDAEIAWRRCARAAADDRSDARAIAARRARVGARRLREAWYQTARTRGSNPRKTRSGRDADPRCLGAGDRRRVGSGRSHGAAARAPPAPRR